MMQQMNIFNTSPEVAGFKLDYLEVWNWGTFDQKVYCMNTQGNNSLLTGANASGKSTLVDALLTLLVPLKRQRFYNQSSGVEKGLSEVFGYIGVLKEYKTVVNEERQQYIVFAENKTISIPEIIITR